MSQRNRDPYGRLKTIDALLVRGANRAEIAHKLRINRRYIERYLKLVRKHGRKYFEDPERGILFYPDGIKPIFVDNLE